MISNRINEGRGVFRDDHSYASVGSTTVSSGSKYVGALSAASLLAAIVISPRSGRIGLAFGTIALAGGALSLLGCGGANAKQWEKSGSQAQSDEVDQYASQGNADKLDEIGNTARSRSAALAENIRQARQSGSKTVDHEGRKISLKDAEALVVFDRLVAVRADLNENRLSKNVQSRIGGELPETWERRLQEGGGKAQQSQFDGYLLLLLDQLEGEVSKDQATAGRLTQEIASFEKTAPQVQIQKAQSDLQGFQTGEVGREQSLFGQYTSLVNQRAHQRLYAGNADYHAQYDRNNRLSVLNSTLVSPALDAAVYIDTQLGEMIQNRRQEFIFLAEAKRHERILTTCYRDEPYHVPNVPGGDEDSEGGIKRGGGRPSGGDEDSEGGIRRGGGATPRGGDEDSEGGIKRGGSTAPRSGDEDSEGGIRRGGGTSHGGDEDSEGGILRQGMLGSGLAEIRYRKVPYQCYVDQSGTYKNQAAIFAERAKSAAQNAQARLNGLQPLIAQLYRDPVIKTEGLEHLLPRGSVRPIRPGQGGYEYLFYNPWFDEIDDFFGHWRGYNSLKDLDEAISTKSEFGPTLSALRNLQGAVGSKRGEASGFVSRTVQADLTRQREEARSMPAPTPTTPAQ